MGSPLAGLATDSLYEFMALAGLACFLLISWYAFNKETELALRYVDHISYAQKLGYEVGAIPEGEAQNREYNKAKDLVKADHDRHQILVNNFYSLLWRIRIAQGLSLILMFWGFKLWYYKIQIYQDLLLKNQAEATIPDEPDPEPAKDPAE